MNIVQLQDQLKNFSQDQLVREMQMPSGNAPQFLVLGEIMRRKRMQDDFTAQQAKGDQGTVAQEAVAAAGVPQGGIADMARAMAPSTDMVENTGVQAMYAGGPVKKMAEGDIVIKEGLRFIEQADGSLVPEGGVGTLTRLPPAPDRSGGIGTLVEDPMLAAAEESANEVAAAREEAGITQSLKDAKEVAAAAAAAKEAEAANNPAEEAAPAAPAAPKAGGSGSGGMSSYEQELIAMMQKREKAAEQDKWLALAQVGLNLMSSTQPTLGGALGEAGLKGVEAAQTARDQYDKDRLSLLGELEQSRMARAAAAAKAAGGARAKPVSTAIIGQYADQLAAIDEQLARLGPPPEPGWWSGEVDDPYAAERTQLEEQRAAIQAALGYGYATHGMPYFGAESEYDADVSD
jgi:hypothetical protein